MSTFTSEERFMDNVIIIIILIVIIGLAGFYIYREKKSGKKCIGCPYSKSCSSKDRGCCGEKSDL